MTSLLQRGCVKSVQRGYRSVAADEILSNKSISINISPINPNKSLLLIDVNLNYDGYSRQIFFNLLGEKCQFKLEKPFLPNKSLLAIIKVGLVSYGRPY